MTPETSAQPVPNQALDQGDQPWKLRFFVIWSGQALSLIGSALTQFILVWWITSTTGSPTALAIAGIMGLLPQALFGPLGGTLADRWSRRRIMIGADLITALCMVVLIALFATDTVQLWHLYGLMFVRSSMQAFQAPASMASTSLLVPPSWLARVAGMNQTLYGLMSVAAAPLGAVALAYLPLQGALMIDVVTAVLGIVPLFFFAIPQPKPSGGASSSVWQDFRSGLRLVLGNRGLVWLYSITVLMVAVVMPSLVLIPLLVRDVFSGGVNEVALMEGAGGAGMLLGGVLVSVIALPRSRISVILGTFALSCLTIACMGLTPSTLFWVAIFWWFVSGLLYTVGNAPVLAILQTIVPNEMQGRALSLFSTLMGVAGPLGLVFAAPLGEWIGVRGLLVGGGVLGALVCLSGFLSPHLMRIEDQQSPNQTP